MAWALPFTSLPTSCWMYGFGAPEPPSAPHRPYRLLRWPSPHSLSSPKPMSSARLLSAVTSGPQPRKAAGARAVQGIATHSDASHVASGSPGSTPGCWVCGQLASGCICCGVAGSSHWRSSVRRVGVLESGPPALVAVSNVWEAERVASIHRRRQGLGDRGRYGNVVVQALPGAGGGAVAGGGGGGGGKVRRVFVCSKCGARHGQYHGKCSKCGGFGTIDRDGLLDEPVAAGGGGGAGGRAGGGGGGAGVQALERVQQDAALAAALAGTDPARAQQQAVVLPYSDEDGDTVPVDRSVGWVVNGGSSSSSGGGDGGFGGSGGSSLDDLPLSLRTLSRMGRTALGRDGEGRIALSGRTGAEVQRVLGGGVVPGALVLIGGDPGVGKSTITLQIAAMMAHPEIDFDSLEDQLQLDQDQDLDLGLDDREYGAATSLSSGGAYDSDAGGQIGATFSEHGGDAGSFGAGGAVNPVGATGGGADDGNGGAGSAVAPGPVRKPRTVLYITAEETREQVVHRSRRMGLDGCDRVAVLCSSEMSGICRAVLQLRPDALVMDSINTVYLSSLSQAPGTITQIRECGQLLLRLAKDHRIAVFIIGHVTKGGEMAGPNMLAHMVDTVLYMEGDVAQSIRLLRVIKNRHGSDSECGVFTMDGSGLHAVANHSALFLENRLAESQGAEGEPDSGASSVVGVTLQGSRAILVEVQALVSPLGDRAAPASSALAYRAASGVDKLRLANLCAILDKYVPTLELSCCSVIVNVVGGTQVKDVASDLALAVAIASSYYNTPVPRDLAVCGEVDLAGRVRRSFQRLDVRVREAAKLGFRTVVIPQTKGWERLAHDPHLRSAGVKVVAVRSVAEALRVSLGPGVSDHRPPHIRPPPRGKPPFGTGPPGARFSRQRRTSVVQDVPYTIDADSSWAEAASLGGVEAAFAAAATAPPLQPPYYRPPPGAPMPKRAVATPGLGDTGYDGEYDEDASVYGNGMGFGDEMYDETLASANKFAHGGNVFGGGAGAEESVPYTMPDNEWQSAGWSGSVRGWAHDDEPSQAPLPGTDAPAPTGPWAADPEPTRANGDGGTYGRAELYGSGWAPDDNPGASEDQQNLSLRAQFRTKTAPRRPRGPRGSARG